MLSGFDMNLNGFQQFGATEGGKNIDDIVDSDTSILFRCMYALATGGTLKNSFIGNLGNNERASAFAATDIIRNLATKTNKGVLKSLMTFMLQTHSISHALNKILNKFGVCPSHQSVRIKDIRSCDSALLNGMMDTQVDSHDLWLLLYDNIGFRICGSQPGWLQYVAMQLLRIPKETLQKWDIYPDPARQDQVLKSWENGKCWKEVREDVNYEEIFGTNEKDVAEVILKTVETLIGLEVEGCLPSYDDCYQLAKQGRSFNWPTGIPRESGETTVVAKEGGSDFATATVHVNNNNTTIFETNYDANNVIVDRPVEKDLNSREAVLMLMQYAKQIMKKVENKEVDEEWNDIEKIVNKYGVPLLGDRNPSHMIQNILKEDKYSTDFKDIKAFSGGFHLILEAHRKRGSLFAKSHLEDFFHLGERQWVS